LAELFQITVNFLASVVVWSLRNNKTARQFISFPNVDPIDTFKQLDSLYFQQTEYTKGSRLMKFFRMTRDKGERLPVFLAHLDAARRELRTMFNFVVTDEDYKSVMQENLPPELISMYHNLNRQQASLADIRLELISLEASIVKPSIEAHFNEYVRKDSDQKRDIMIIVTLLVSLFHPVYIVTILILALPIHGIRLSKTKNRMESLKAIRAGTEEEMMIEIGIIAVTSLARIHDLSNDLFAITLVMDVSHECDSLDEAKSVVMNLMKDLIKERWPSFEDIEGISKYDQLSADMDNHISLRTISKISRKDMFITKYEWMSIR
jgi:hypothetical protein